eukprot:CFRG5277T1
MSSGLRSPIVVGVIAAAAVVAAAVVYNFATTPAPAVDANKESVKHSKSTPKSVNVSPTKAASSTKPVVATNGEDTAKEEKEKAPEHPRDEANRLKNEGNALFRDGKFELAIERYTSALTLNSNSEDQSKYYANRAACFAKLKNYDKVIDDCTAALKWDPRYVKALQRRAQAYEITGELEKAVKDYTLAVSLNPQSQNANAHNVIEELLQQIAQKKAKDKMKEKQGMFPSSSIVKTYLNTFTQPKISAPLRELEKKVAESTDSSVDTLYTLGVKYVQENQYNEGLQTFQHVIKADPKHAQAYIEEGMLLHLSGDIPNALVSFEKGIELEPENAQSYVKWANALYFNQEVEKANQMLEKAIRIAPNDTVGYFHAGQAAAQQNMHQKATEYYDKVIELDYKHYDAYNNKGLALMGMGQADVVPEAIKAFKKAIKIRPEAHEAYNSYGLLLRVLEKNDEALAQFNKALQVDPTSATAYTNKGFLHLHVHQNFESAKELFMKAIEVDPSCIEAHCNLAIVYLEQNAIDKAVKCYDEAIQLSFFEQDLTTIYGFREAAILRKSLMEDSVLAGSGMSSLAV